MDELQFTLSNPTNSSTPISNEDAANMAEEMQKTLELDQQLEANRIAEREEAEQLRLQREREIKKEEYELTKSVLINKPGKFISGATENERQGKIKDLDLDVFICGWSRYDIQNFVKQKFQKKNKKTKKKTNLKKKKKKKK